MNNTQFKNVNLKKDRNEKKCIKINISLYYIITRKRIFIKINIFMYFKYQKVDYQ